MLYLVYKTSQRGLDLIGHESSSNQRKFGRNAKYFDA